ncbi:unnamed protein product [Moneuplotes crassus]|uniref:Uncharacterized protein n=1 Tax=Euplotes crassus TaxID=5936 RepID=A0AAD2D6P8_EUPCR|nr:unnamed protein product [Moneuplotes crassus]
MLTQADTKITPPTKHLKKGSEVLTESPAPTKKAIHKSTPLDLSKSFMEEYAYIESFLLEGTIFWSLKAHNQSGKVKFLPLNQIPACDKFHLNERNQ